MHQAQTDVEAFHRALDMPVSKSPGLRRVELRTALVAEEAKELIEAAERADLVAAVDALCDLLYVVYGAAVEWGVDLEPHFAEVHRTNMAKTGGPVRHDGKRLKPEGWEPPDIAGILRNQLAAAPAEPEQGNFTSIVGRSATAALGG